MFLYASREAKLRALKKIAEDVTKEEQEYQKLFEDEQPGESSSFVKHRKMIVPMLKDFRKSQQTKHNWRTNKNSMLKGIKKWHSDPEGKKFHRQLGRFLATRPDAQGRRLLPSIHANEDTEPISVDNLQMLKRELLNEQRSTFSSRALDEIGLVLEELDQELKNRVIR